MADTIVHDVCRSCHTFDADNRGILVDYTNSKGLIGIGQLPDGLTIGGMDGGGSCITCHTGNIEVMHHANAHVAIGECEYCHADPRMALKILPRWPVRSVMPGGIMAEIPWQLSNMRTGPLTQPTAGTQKIGTGLYSM